MASTLQTTISELWSPLLLLSLAAFILWFLTPLLFSGLGHIPGPFISKFSNLWKINAAYRGEMPQRNIALHRKYGPLVRMGPNLISVDDPAALPIIYTFKPIWRKV